MAIDSIFAHKLRSFLVTLGILIGITAVLVNAAMVSGFQAYFEKQMQELGSNFVNITPGSGTAAMMGIYDEETYLSQNTFESVRRLPYVKDASADRVAFGRVSYMGEDEEVAVIGVEPGFFVARDQNLALGNSFTAQDRYTVIVDESVLSGSTSRPLALMSRVEITVTTPEGRRVTEEFRVKGLAEQMQAGFGISYVYVPIRTLNDLLGTKGYNEITLYAVDMEHIGVVEDEARELLDRLLKVEPNREPPTEQAGIQMFGIGLGGGSDSGNDKYTIVTQEDILDISRDITAMIQLALVIIASISLLVGGIGIANVMLVTVAERTREIGVMKAVGAKNRHLLISFLFEAGVIGFLGGVAGLLVAAAGTYTMVPLLMGVPGEMSISWTLVALGISVGISVVSGLYPALRASRMDPVEALRSE